MSTVNALNLGSQRLDSNPNVIRRLMKRTDERISAASRTHSALVEICARLVHSGALVLAFSLALGPPQSSARTIPPLTAEFSWTVPPRLVVNEHTGLIRSLDEAEIVPADGWPVQFNACDSSSRATSFGWTIDGGEVIIENRCDAFEYRFPTEGLYQVRLTVTGAAGASAQTTQNVTVQDWLIVGLGDSYASGEGVPDSPIGKKEQADLANAGQVVMNAQATLGDRESELQTTIDKLGPLKEKYDASVNTQRTISQKATDFKNKYDKREELCTPVPVKIPVTEKQKARKKECEKAKEQQDAAYDTLKDAVVNIDWTFNTRDLDGLRGVLQSLVDNAKTPYETANTARVEALKLKGEAEEALNTATSDRNNVKDRIFATWQDRRCHRSLASGQAQAARQIEDDDPRTSVTFIHLACSGAKIEEGLLEGYRGIRPTRKEEKDKALLDAQVDEFKETVGDREVDAVLISIGGNDVGFADIITRCMFAEKCYEKPFILQNVPLAMAYANCVETRQWSYEYDCNSILETEFGPRENVEELFQTGKRGLPGGYRKLNEKLLEVNELDPHRVYISEHCCPVKSRIESIGWGHRGIPLLSG